MGRKGQLGHAVNTGRMREMGRKKAGGCCLGWKKGGGPQGKERKRRGKIEVGWREVGPRGLERKGKGEGREGGVWEVFFFFFKPFQTHFFKLLKLNSFSNSKFKLSLTFQTFKTF
jgi:hypothetical protein